MNIKQNRENTINNSKRYRQEKDKEFKQTFFDKIIKEFLELIISAIH